MDFEKWYRRGGLILSGGVAATFLICVYAWLFGLRAPLLDMPFQVFLIVFLVWLIASPFFIRNWRKGISLLITGLLVLLIAPSLLLGHSFLQLFIPSAVILKALSSPVNWFYLFFSGVYVLLVVVVGRFAALGADMGLAFQQRTLISFGAFLLLLFVPEMMSVGVVDKLHREWYSTLLSLRGQYIPHWSRVAVVNIQAEGMPERRLRDLLGILAQSHPSLVVVTWWTGAAFPDSVRKNHGLEVIARGWRSDTTSPVGIVTADGFVTSWRSETLPLYYQPSPPGGVDLGVKAVLALLRKRKTDQTYAVHDREVRVGSSTIPLLPDGRVLINYYRNIEKVRVSGGMRTEPAAPFPMYTYWEFYEGETLVGYLWGFGRSVTSARVNYRKKFLEDQIGKEITERDDKTLWKTRKWEPLQLLNLQDKILVVDLRGRFDVSHSFHSAGFVYACIIQNILDKDFLNEPPGWVTLLLTLFLIALITGAFMKHNVYKASLWVLGGCLLTAGIFALIFLWSSSLINPYPALIPFAGAILFFLPIGISSDRKNLFQEQSRLQAELRTAHDMQMGLMPSADPVVKGFDISGTCVPANEVGGDFYDYVWLDQKQTKLGIALADVSGKAMKAAMTAVMTSGMIYRELGSSGTPKTILRRMNKPMYAKLDQRMFTAMSLAVIDLRTRELTFSNAGQVHPLMLRNSQIRRLKVEGARLPLGVKEEVKYEELKVKLKKNDTIVLFTDGIVEAMNEERELYGMERLEREVLSAGGFTSKALKEHLIADVRKFAGKAEQHDDMTVVVVKVIDTARKS